MADSRRGAGLTRRRVIGGGLALGALAFLAACGGGTAATVAPTTAPAASTGSGGAAATTTTAPAASAAATTRVATAQSAAASATVATRTTSAATVGTATRATGAATPSVAGSPAAGGTTGGPRQVDTPNGRITVPANPQRVVSVNYISTWTMLDLGVTPLATAEYPSNLPAVYADAWAKLPKIGTQTDIDIEKVAALRPDLILGINAPNYSAPFDRLSVLAPTVAFAAVSGVANWDQLSAQFAAALGRADQIAALQSSFTQKTTTIKNTYTAKLAQYRWAFVQGLANGQWNLVNDIAGSGKIATQAGIRLTAGATGKTTSFTAFSNEQLSELATADVIVGQAGTDGKFDAATQALIDSALFKTLPASAAGRIFPVTNFFPGSYGIALGLLDQITEVCKKL